MVANSCNYPFPPIQDSPVFDNLPVCNYTFQAFDENNQASEPVRVKVGLQIEPNFYLSCGLEKGLYFVNLRIFNSYNHSSGQYVLDQGSSPYYVKVAHEGKNIFYVISDTGTLVQIEYLHDPAKQTIVYITDACGDFDSTLYRGDLLQELRLTLIKTCEGQYIFNNNLAKYGIGRNSLTGKLNFQWYLNDRLIVDSTTLVLNSFGHEDRVKLKVSGVGCNLEVKTYSSIDTNTVPMLLTTNVEGGSICSKRNSWLRLTKNQDPGVTIQWSTGETTDSLQVVNPGKFTAIGKNSFGCRDTLEWIITPSTLAIRSSISDNRCFGKSEGSITLEPEGLAKPYRYEWQDHSTTKYLELLNAGTYSVTVVDADACQSVFSFEVKGPPQLKSTVTVSNSTCIISPNGEAYSVVEGGSPPYILKWSNGHTLSRITGLSSGAYSLHIQDKNQCMDSVSFSIEDETRLYILNDSICFGSVYPVGKNVYSSTGEYLDTLLSRGGCDSIVQTRLYVAAPLKTEVLSFDPRCYLGMDGQITIKTLNGYPDFKFYLNNKIVNSANMIGLDAGEYKIKIEDRMGCVSESQLRLRQPAPLRFSLGRDTTLDYGDSLYVRFTGKPDNDSITTIKWETNPFQGSCTNCFSTFSYLPNQDHTLRALVMTRLGCSGEASMNITIQRNFKVYTPNLFKPEGLNSSNRYFTIYGNRQLLKINFLRIYNRNGDLVFEVENGLPNQPESGWDGRFRGQDADSGVYVFVAELVFADQSKEIIKGDVFLQR